MGDMNSTIPKRIIQTGKSVDLPPICKAAVANVKLLNPDFEYLFFDNGQVGKFIDNIFAEYRTVFDAFPHPIQRYDFFRYLAVYHFGGFYFDLDLLMSEALSDLLENSCVFTFESIGINQYLKRNFGMHWDIGNYAFGAAPDHPFIRVIIDNCIKAQVEPE
jgi:mannosyltransferase OCH1-like enzyme